MTIKHRDKLLEKVPTPSPRVPGTGPRVIATEIMQLSGGNVFVNLEFLKETSKKQVIIFYCRSSSMLHYFHF